MMATLAAYGAGSGVHEAAASCAAMIHRKAAVTVRSRFETERAAETAMTIILKGVHATSRQGAGHRGAA